MHLSSSSKSTAYRFANCVLRSDTRELLRDGVIQKLERRCFDLILYLIQQKGRVVSKEELLQNVWANRYVSDSVVAQSIMKARRALGCKGREEGPIRTLHRVGYRFVADVQPTINEPSPAYPASREQAVACVRWLPTEADASLLDQDWLKTGLISLVSHLLRSHGVQTQPWSGQGDKTGCADEPHDTALVRTRLRQVEREYRLDWQLDWAGLRSTQHGSAHGPSPVELFQRAAIEVALWVRLHVLAPTEDREAADLWRDLMRLLQMSDSLDATAHMAPLEALMDRLKVSDPRAMAECLLLLAMRGEPSTVAHANQLRAIARHSGSHALEGWAELCLAFHALYAPNRARARTHVSKAVALLHLAKPHARVAKGLGLSSHVLATLGDVDQARQILVHAMDLSEQLKVSSLLPWHHTQAAELCLLDGELATHSDIYAQAVSSARSLGMDGLSAQALVYQGLHLLARGDLTAAKERMQDAEWIGDRGACPRTRLFVHLHLGLLCARTRDPEGLDRCLMRLSERRVSQTWPGGACATWLRARRLLLDDRHEAALPLLEHAKENLGDWRAWWMEDAWLLLGQVQLHVGHTEAVRRYLQELRGRRLPPGRPFFKATPVLMEGMLALFLGDAESAAAHFHQARPLAQGTLLAPTVEALLGQSAGLAVHHQGQLAGAADLLPPFVRTPNAQPWGVGSGFNADAAKVAAHASPGQCLQAYGPPGQDKTLSELHWLGDSA